MFPIARSSTDIRSWFGLVNQFASYDQLRDLIEPFRLFLGSKVEFHWDKRLDQRLIDSKGEIVTFISNGVRIF